MEGNDIIDFSVTCRYSRNRHQFFALGCVIFRGKLQHVGDMDWQKKYRPGLIRARNSLISICSFGCICENKCQRNLLFAKKQNVFESFFQIFIWNALIPKKKYKILSFSTLKTLSTNLNVLFIRNLTYTFSNFPYSEKCKAFEFNNHLLCRISIF